MKRPFRIEIADSDGADSPPPGILALTVIITGINGYSNMKLGLGAGALMPMLDHYRPMIAHATQQDWDSLRTHHDCVVPLIAANAASKNEEIAHWCTLALAIACLDPRDSILDAIAESLSAKNGSVEVTLRYHLSADDFRYSPKVIGHVEVAGRA